MKSNNDNNNNDTFTGRSEGRPRGGGNRHNDGGGSDDTGGGGGGRSDETPGATGDGLLGNRASTSSSARKRAREEEATGAGAATAAAAVEASSGGSPLPAARGGRSPGGGGYAAAREMHRARAPSSLPAAHAGVSAAAASLGYGSNTDGAEGAALASFAASLLAAGRERDAAWARDREELALRAALLGQTTGLFPPSMSASTSSSLSAAAALDVPTQLLLLSQLPNSGWSAHSLAGAFSQPPQLPQLPQPRDALQEYIEAQAHLLLLSRHPLLPPSLPSQREWGLVELMRAQQAAALQRDTAAVEAALSSSFTTPASAAASGPYPWDLMDPRLLEARRSSPVPRMFPSVEEQKDAMTENSSLWPSAGSPFRRLAGPSLSPPPAWPPPPPPAVPQAPAAATAATSKPNVPPSPPVPTSQPPPMVPCRFHPRAINVSLSTDEESTSKFQALLRDQLLYVEAVPLDVQASTQGRNRPIRAGQVGILCRHCRNIPPRNRPRGAIYFPHKLLSIYQSAQNMANHHYHPESGCPNASDDINASLRLARADKSIVYGGGQQYWARAASESGLVETEGGLAFSFAAPTATTTTTTA